MVHQVTIFKSSKKLTAEQRSGAVELVQSGDGAHWGTTASPVPCSRFALSCLASVLTIQASQETVQESTKRENKNEPLKYDLVYREKLTAGGQKRSIKNKAE